MRPTRSSSTSPRWSASAPADAVQHGLEPHELAPGHQRVDGGVLQGDADRPAHRARLGHHVVAGHPGPPGGRAQERGEHAHEGGLAGAVRPEEAEDLALLDDQVDAGDGGEVAEAPDEALRLDRVAHEVAASDRAATPARA